MKVAKKKQRRIVIPGIVRRDEERLKRKLRSKACSEPWVEAQLRYTTAHDKDGNPMAVAEYRKGIFPVKGMIPCRGCERPTPPQCVGSSGHCDDCRLAAMSPRRLARLQGSTSVVNLAKVKAAIRRGATKVPGGI